MLDTIGPWLVGLAALISSGGSIYAVIISRSTHESTSKKTANEAIQVGDSTWIARLEALNKNFSALQLLSDQRFEKLVAIEQLLTDHVSWDWDAVRKFREHGIDVADPPSLIVVQQLSQQAREQEQEAKSIVENGK